MNIYVGNLPFKLSEEELKSTFEVYGDVASAKIIMDNESGRSKGFGFVEMPDDQNANEAIKNLDGKEVGGRQLKVNVAKPLNKRK